MSNPTESQSFAFENIRRILPAETVFNAENLHGQILLEFDYVDPRPSRNGLSNAGLRGIVVIGKRGGIRSYYLSPAAPFSVTQEGKSKGFWIGLRVSLRANSHCFYA